MPVPPRDRAPDVSVADVAGADVVGAAVAEPARSRPSRAVQIGAAAAAVLVTAVLLRLAGGEGAAPAAPQALTGSLLISSGSSSTADLPFGNGQERDGVGAGPVHLELPDRDVGGTARVDFSASFDADERPEDGYFHFWGTVRLDLESTTCRGTFGWSNFDDPLEGGGSVHARCEDGATLAAALVATPQPEDRDGILIDLRDGWYVAGRAP